MCVSVSVLCPVSSVLCPVSWRLLIKVCIAKGMRTQDWWWCSWDKPALVLSKKHHQSDALLLPGKASPQQDYSGKPSKIMMAFFQTLAQRGTEDIFKRRESRGNFFIKSDFRNFLFCYGISYPTCLACKVSKCCYFLQVFAATTPLSILCPNPLACNQTISIV